MKTRESNAAVDFEAFAGKFVLFIDERFIERIERSSVRVRDPRVDRVLIIVEKPFHNQVVVSLETSGTLIS